MAAMTTLMRIRAKSPPMMAIVILCQGFQVERFGGCIVAPWGCRTVDAHVTVCSPLGSSPDPAARGGCGGPPRFPPEKCQWARCPRLLTLCEASFHAAVQYVNRGHLMVCMMHSGSCRDGFLESLGDGRLMQP